MALRLCAGATNAEGEITTWLDLYNAISAGGTVTLTQNITAGRTTVP